ncbi:hypothetical protein [Halosimplex amylolyticum]|uniref:hypothetical protein n=1 Tax=Halosimplex amylolyticum TaxID=3396616 RepID=UPI003F55A139
MGATAVVSSSASATSSAAGVSATVTSLLSPVGTGVGGVAVAITLVYVLAHLDVVSASPDGDERVRQTLVAASIPLGLTFAGIVLFRTMQIL